MSALAARSLRRVAVAPRDRVWLLSLLMAATASALLLTFAAALVPPAAAVLPDGRLLPPAVLAAALALLFAVTEWNAVHVKLRSDTYSFAQAEIPLVVGLVFLPPPLLLVANVGGSALALVVHRRQAPRKLIFNLSLFALTSVIAALVFHVLAAGAGPLDPRTWAAALVATVAADILSAVAISSAIALSGGARPQAGDLVSEGILFTIANSAAGMLTAFALSVSLVSVALPLAAAVMLWFAMGRWASERRKVEGLQLLQDAMRTAQGSVELGTLLEALLQRARATFQAEVAEVVLYAREGADAIRATATEDGFTLERAVALGRADGVLARVASEAAVDRGPLRLRAERGEGIGSGAERDGVSELMVADLALGDQRLGQLLVANTTRDLASVSAEEERLLAAYADTVAVAASRVRDQERLQQQRDDNRYQATHDALTGLANRSVFRERLEDLTRDGRTPAAVLMMDLDRFKEVNDTLGHRIGDEFLQRIAERLRGSVRDGMLLARLNGDEFAVLVPGVADAASAEAEARALLGALAPPVTVEEMTLEAGATVGIALYPEHGLDADTLLQRADVAMYLAKDAHTGCEVYAVDRDRYSPDRLRLVSDLRRAIERRELHVLYQPLQDLATGRIVAAEALVRWAHPLHGLLPPDEFLPIAERTGLIRPLALAVLEDAVHQARAWHDAGLAITVSVNLSARNLLDVELPTDIERLLGEVGLPAAALELEITETSATTDLARTQRVLRQLRALGVRLSIDDFGTGYFTVSNLRKLPVDELKIDRSFVMGMIDEDEDEAIVQWTVELGRRLGLRVVAEGVESAEALERLAALGCDRAQGYHIARPMRAGAFLAWLQAAARRATTLESDGPLTRLRAV